MTSNLFGDSGEFDAVHEIVALLSPKSESTQQSKLVVGNLLAQLFRQSEHVSCKRHDNDDNDNDNHDDTKDNK